MAELPGAAVKRIVVKHGGDLRISGSALEAAVAAAEDYIGRLARAAGQSAAEGKRKTIMDGDIEKARQVTG
jgi:histone H3/H4